ncbi:ricin-type beta-trefoil lectin domain protein [Dactylosporangium sp. NPDC048998]|uniref:ricin-type beta-trefoil lectin domain protein n=1 Tax=Dactylosporangium sp. NPDC048998 TaxID=3363976 RepID=UPI00370FD218
MQRSCRFRSHSSSPAPRYCCNGTGAQQWTAPGDGTLRALGKCLDATAGGTGNGTKLQLFDCAGAGGQQRTYVPATQALRNPAVGPLPGRPFQQHDQRHPAATLGLQRDDRAAGHLPVVTVTALL